MRISWSVGEASGDHIAALLIRELKELTPDALHHGVFGPKMRFFLDQPLKHQSLENQENLSVNGLGDTFARIPFFLNLKKRWKRELLEYHPDLLILIDFSGFNQKLMSMAQGLGIQTLIIAPPQIWVWRSYRAKKYLNAPLVAILPVDYEAWKMQGAQVEYLGCPHLEGFDKESIHSEIELLICPGSRKAQVLRSLPLMLELAQLRLIEGCVVVLAANQEIMVIIQDILRTTASDFDIRVELETHFHLNSPIKWAWSTLGTNSLKLAYHGVPTTLIHRLDFLTYWVGMLFIKKKLFALPNILCKRNALQEIIFTGNKVNWVNQMIQRPDNQVTKSLADHLKRELGESHFSKECSSMIVRMIHG